MRKTQDSHPRAENTDCWTARLHIFLHGLFYLMNSFLSNFTEAQLCSWGRGSSNVTGLLAQLNPSELVPFPWCSTSGSLAGDRASDHKREFLTWHRAALPHRKKAPCASAHFPWLHLHTDLTQLRKNCSWGEKKPLWQIITSMKADSWRQGLRTCHAAKELHAPTYVFFFYSGSKAKTKGKVSADPKNLINYVWFQILQV